MMAVQPLEAEKPSSRFEEELAGTSLWTLALVPGAEFLALALVRALFSDPVLGRLTALLVSTSAMLFWVLRVTPHQDYRLRELLGEPPRASDWGPLLGVVAANLGLGVALQELGRITGVPLAVPVPSSTASSGVGAIIDVANLVVFGILLAPVAEELVFRGVLFRKWRRTLGSVKGLLLSSALFGVIHGGGMLPVAVAGLSFSLLYTSTRSLWAPILAHILNNCFSVASVLVWSLGGRRFVPNLTTTQAAVLLCASLAGLLAFGWRSASTLSSPLPPLRSAPLLAPAETQE
ncbi:MAG: putative rane peptidase YdiL [Pseudomonadota bacterium]|jgi:membrane protease YdiL (CAAX protease family)